MDSLINRSADRDRQPELSPKTLGDRGLDWSEDRFRLTLTNRSLGRIAAHAPGDFGQCILLEPLAAAVRKMVKAIGSDSAEDLSQLSDEELMSRYREEGQAAVFTELVHRYERELYRYLARYLGDQTSAEDVFQNTFLQVHLKRGLFENGRPFRPWLYAIATHQAVDALRKSGRHPTVSLDQRINPARSESEAGNLVDLLVSDNAGPLAELQESERHQWVRDSIARLPDALRQTLILAYHQDLKYREIAEILKIPVGTVKSRLHSALEKLQQMARSAKRGEDE